MLKVAELMAEASFIQKRIEALKVEQELSNAQARVTFKRNYPSWSTSDARNCSLVNEIWTPDPALLPSQDTSPTENLIHHQLKIYFTKAEIRK